MHNLIQTFSLLVALLTICTTSFVQDLPYWRYDSEGKRDTLHAIPDRFAVFFQSEDRALVRQSLEDAGREVLTEKILDGTVIQEVAGLTQAELLASVRQNAALSFSPVFEVERGTAVIADQIIVYYHEPASPGAISEMEKKYRLRRVENEAAKWLNGGVLYRLLPPYQLSALEVANAIYETGLAESSEPNLLYELKAPSASTSSAPTPNDPLYSSQWNLTKTNVQDAWNYTTGSSAVRIAIVDEGVNLTHPDLAPRLLRDSGGNVVGLDATDQGDNSPEPLGNDAHGTASAGIAAALTNNGAGVAGVSWNSRIIPIQVAYKVPNGQGQWVWYTNDTWLAAGINFAWQNDADVISNSWGGGSNSTAINTAIANAVANGSVVVFSSGNYQSGQAKTVLYPARNPNVIAVGATNRERPAQGTERRNR